MLEQGDDEAIIQYVSKAGFTTFAADLRQAQADAKKPGRLYISLVLQPGDPVARHVAETLLERLDLIVDLHDGLEEVAGALLEQRRRLDQEALREQAGLPRLPPELDKLRHLLAEEVGGRERRA